VAVAVRRRPDEQVTWLSRNDAALRAILSENTCEIGIFLGSITQPCRNALDYLQESSRYC
jgi:hypothetical protein